MSWKNWILGKKETATGPVSARTLFGAPSAKKTQSLNGFYQQNFSNLRAALSNGTSVEGRLAFDAPVRIDGALLGEIYSTAEVIIGPEAKISGQLQADSLVVFGKISGNINASGKVVLLDGARVEGDVCCQSLSFTDGAVFNGFCRMPEITVVEQRAIA